MSRQWFSVVPTTDMSISDITNVDISNIKAIFQIWDTATITADPFGRYYTPFDMDIQSNNWQQCIHTYRIF